jgi:acetylglutamate kinase
MIVIKYGGHALPTSHQTPLQIDPILSQIAQWQAQGEQIVLVHGGGPQINAELEFHNLPAEMIGGYRNTTPEIFELVQQVLSGKVLRTLVNQLIGAGANVVGLSSGDGGVIRARPMRPAIDGVASDIGQVGDIDQVDGAFLQLLLNQGYLPVISPVGVTESGMGLNLNADLVAGAVAGALKADQVIFMTDVAGIYRDFPNPESIIDQMSASELERLAPTFSAGMIPKVKAALFALEHGASSARVIDGRELSNLRLAVAGSGGTLITKLAEADKS